MTDPSRKFAGFGGGRLAFTSLPSAFFSQLLPKIDDLGELKVTLHLFWALQQKKGDLRCVRWEELLADRTLAASLGPPADTLAERLAQALEKAMARGTVLNVVLDLDGKAGTDSLYFLNTVEGRRTAQQVRRGEVVVPPLRRRRPPAALPVARSAAVTLYEREISLLTPDIASALATAERDYGAAAVAEAIGEAVRYERRHWAYVQKVLEQRSLAKGGATADG